MKKTVSILLITATLLLMLPFSASAADKTVTDSQNVVYALSNNGAYYVVTGCDKPTASVIIPAEINGVPVQSIGNGAFLGNTSLESVVIPDGVKTIGDSAFESCESLKSVVIPDSVTDIGTYAFAWCASLESVVLPAGITSLSEAVFCGCESLADIDIPKSVKVLGAGAFESCESLTSIIIPDGVTDICESAFYACTGISSIAIPDSAENIEIMAFAACERLCKISVGTNNPNYSSENGILFNKDKTELVCYPAGKTEAGYAVPESVKTICDSAFLYCMNLTSIDIPESVTIIEGWAFVGCIGLKEIIIPETVTSVGECAFAYWKGDQTIYCRAEAIPSDWDEAWAEDCEAKVIWNYGTVKGDVNGNGMVDALDYGLAKRHVLGTYELAEDMLKRGDLNGDGELTASEYGLIKRHVLGTYTIV